MLVGGHGHGPLPSLLLFAPSPSQITKHLFDKQMGMNWQGARIPYNLISVYSAVSKESFVSKELDFFGFATKYLLTDIFLFSHCFPKRRNG